MAPQAAAASRRRKKSAEAPVVASVNTLRALPSNHLEALKGDRKGQYSIRINRQWRVCFVWEDELGPTDIEIVDYH